MNFQIFASNFKLSSSKILLTDFFPLFHHQNREVKIEASSKKYSWISYQGNKNAEKFIQCSLKESFQGQGNPQKHKNPNKIIWFKAWNFL